MQLNNIITLQKSIKIPKDCLNTKESQYHSHYQDEILFKQSPRFSDTIIFYGIIQNHQRFSIVD